MHTDTQCHWHFGLGPPSTRRLAETCQESDLNINTQNPRAHIQMQTRVAWRLGGYRPVKCQRISKHPQVRCHHVFILQSMWQLRTPSCPADSKVISCLRA